MFIQKGDVIPIAVKVGDQVLLPEYGGTKVEIEEKEYHLFRESDLLAKIDPWIPNALELNWGTVEIVSVSKYV